MTEIQKWADTAMYKAQPIASAGPRVTIINATTDPLGSLASACAIYEGRKLDRRDVVDIERERYWEQVAKTHLKAPLETIDFHFFIEGVTRAFTHQMVRQRTAVYAQESLRFAVKEDLAEEIELPPSIRQGSIEAGVWREAIDAVEKAYKYLIGNGVPAEDARGLLPHATRTRLHYKTNLRNLVDHVGNRLCTQAQFEWRLVISSMVHAIRSYGQGTTDHWQFRLIADSEYFRPVCYHLGRCPFGADFDRGCTIRPRVEEGRFDDIDVSEWLLDPAAARRKPDEGEGEAEPSEAGSRASESDRP